MKKILIGAGVLIVLLVAGAGFYFYQNSIVLLSIDDILPTGPVFYYRATEVSKNIEEFKSSKFWQSLSRINLALLEEKSGLPPEQIKMTDEFLSQVSGAVSSPEFKKFFGREVALVFYPADIDLNKPESYQAIVSNIVLVTRLAPDARVSEFFSGIYKKFGQNPHIKEMDYKHHKITLIELPNQMGTIAYSMVKDLMVLGWNEQAAKNSIDVLTRGKAPLSGDHDFVTAQKRFLPKPQTVIYGNFDYFKSGLTKYLLELSNEQAGDLKMKEEYRKQIEESFSTFKGFKTISLSSVPGKIFKSKFSWIIDKNAMSPDLKAVYSCAPKANASINFIPQNILAYEWSSCLNARYYWDSIKKELQAAHQRENGPQSNLEDDIQQMETNLGLSLEGDIIPAVGDEMGGYLADIETKGAFPMPQAVLFLKLGDKNKAEKVIAKLMENPLAVFQAEDYSGTKINYIDLPLGVNVEPAYCILGDYLLLATNRSLLKSSIDTSKSPGISLASNRDFKDLDMGLTDPNNSIFYLQMGEFMHKLKSVAAWTADITEVETQKRMAFQQGAKKKLDDLKLTITSKEAELKLLQNQTKTMEQQIVDNQAQGIDASALQLQLPDLKNQIDAKEISIKLAKEQEPELEATVDEYSKNSTDPTLIKLYLNEAVNPVLEGLESFTALGTWVRFDGGNSLESMVNVKVE